MEDVLMARLKELLLENPALGFRSLHAKLKEARRTRFRRTFDKRARRTRFRRTFDKREPSFQEVSLKKVQTALQLLRAEPEPSEGCSSAGPGENLWTAASDGDQARVEALMALEGFQPSSQDENGYTPVMAAASWGHAELLSLLLSREPHSANVADTDGDAPLHHVAQACELEADQLRPVLRLLLEAKADVNARNAEGKSCLDCCAMGAMVEGEEEQEPQINLAFLKVMEEFGFKV
ncbi:unnamed protein product [Durusdinium trenchii]|uniref:Uncharacterized protein n=1 Tax=Durusdinium trenchii TaxID=1381693 RepID=A0ABP0RC32_9DINO